MILLLFGWGTKSKSWSISDRQQVVATWKFFHIFSFPFAFKTTWRLVGSTVSPDSEISYAKAKDLLGNRATIGLWQKYGLLLLLADFVGIIAWPSLASYLLSLVMVIAAYVILMEQDRRKTFLIIFACATGATSVFFWLIQSSDEFWTADSLQALVIFSALFSLFAALIARERINRRSLAERT